MMNSTTLKKFTIITGLAIIAAAVSQSEVDAYQFSFDANSSDVSNGTYVYDISLEADETLELEDALSITNLAGVTNVTTDTDPIDPNPNQNGPYTVSLAGLGFGETSANLTVTNESYTTLNNVITIESTVTTLGIIDYEADFSGTGGGTFSSTTLGPSTTAAVPFEFSTGLGIIISTGFFGVQFLRRRFA